MKMVMVRVMVKMKTTMIETIWWMVIVSETETFYLITLASTLCMKK